MKQKPNVILMVADDLGIGDLSCFNPDSKLNTENLDRMASEGIRCTDAHSTSALCTPSRYGLLTGRYNWRSRLKQGVLMGYSRHLIEDGRATLGTLFKEAGYQTACVGKWHLGLDWTFESVKKPEQLPQDRKGDAPVPSAPNVDYSVPVKNGPDAFGFDYSYITPGSLDIAPYLFVENGKVVQPPISRSNVNRKLSGGPMGTGHAGRGVVSDPGDPRIYSWPDGEISADYVHEQVVPDSAERVLRLMEQYAANERPFFLYYPIHAPHLPCLPTPEFAGKSSIGPYGDMVLMVDDIVGRILEKLEKLEIDGDTLFVFTSDNGSENSYPQFGHEPSYRYRGHKSDIWDGGHRIPYIVRWPGHIAPDSTTDQTVSLSDLFATFAEILDIRVQDNEAEDSVSNLSLWLGQDSPVRNHTVSSSGNGMFAIRKGKWKLDMCPGSGGFDEGPDVDKLPPVQLYDMEQDVGETTNLCNEHPEIVASLTELLTKTVIDGRSTPGTPQKNTGPEWWSQLIWLEQP